MSFKLTPQLKVGLFVFVILFLLAYATLKISQTSIMPGGSYPIYVLIDSAIGISKKTPVQIAGIQVGSVVDIDLINNNQARLKLAIRKKVKISKNVEARIKTVGFLGDTYIELYQPAPFEQPLEKNATIPRVSSYGDFSSVAGEVSAIASDVKAITETMKMLMAGEDSSFAKSVKNIEKITTALGNVSTQNEGDLNAIIQNLRAVSENLNLLIASNMSLVGRTVNNMESVSEQVRSGEGTIGRLLYDDQTVEKLNESLDSINEALGGAQKLKVDIGYHTEYLGGASAFKHYVSLALKPRPDKYFLFELVDDPSPDSQSEEKQTTITSSGVTTTVTEETQTTQFDKMLFSAQFAKKFYGFTFRGGLIESAGGVGVDYDYGPLSLQFSAFDFETNKDEKPHLKTMGTINITPSIYLLGGLDDFINKEQDLDWFFGAGIKITDDDIKSMLGLLSLKP